MNVLMGWDGKTEVWSVVQHFLSPWVESRSGSRLDLGKIENKSGSSRDLAEIESRSKLKSISSRDQVKIKSSSSQDQD